MGTNFEIGQDGTIKFNKAMPNIGADDNALVANIVNIFRISEMNNSVSSAVKARKKAIELARSNGHPADAELFVDTVALHEFPGVITRTNLFKDFKWRMYLSLFFLLGTVFFFICLLIEFGHNDIGWCLFGTIATAGVTSLFARQSLRLARRIKNTPYRSAEVKKE